MSAALTIYIIDGVAVPYNEISQLSSLWIYIPLYTIRYDRNGILILYVFVCRNFKFFIRRKSYFSVDERGGSRNGYE